MLSFGIIVFNIYFHYLIFHVNTCPFTYNQAKKCKISFLHFRIWQSWQEIMFIFWSWLKTRKRLFPTFVQTLIWNMAFYCTVGIHNHFKLGFLLIVCEKIIKAIHTFWPKNLNLVMNTFRPIVRCPAPPLTEPMKLSWHGLF